MLLNIYMHVKISRVQILNNHANLAKSETPVSNPIGENELLPAVSSGTLRAYNNIPFKGKFIPKSEFTQWLTGTGFRRTDIIDEVFAKFCDETSQLSEKSFEILKSFHQKGEAVISSMGIFETAKENGRLNYKALNLIDAMMGNQRGFYGIHTNFSKILEMLKDKNGKFDESVIELFEQDIPTFKKYLSIRPDGILKRIKDGEGNFSPEAIKYFKEHLGNNEKIQDILHGLYTAKNPDGTFDFDNIEFMRNFDGIFANRWGASALKEIVRNASKEQRQGIINSASAIKDDERFEYIINYMKTLNLEFNETNIGFAGKLVEITGGSEGILKIITEKIKLTPEMLTEENKKLLSDICAIFKPEELEIILNASIYKAGDEKGQFSFENLNRYKEIYTSRHRRFDIIEKLSKRFALEEEDQALRVFHKLYTMKWSNGTSNPDKINEAVLNFMTSLGTKEINDIPSTQMPKGLLGDIEKLLSSKYATQSRDVFENLMDICPNPEACEKLQRVNLEEIGLKPEQVSAMFTYTDENKLLQFKEFMRKYIKDNNLADVDIATNPNIGNRVEIISGINGKKNILLFDFKKFEPITNMQVEETYYTITQTQRDNANNTETILNFRKKNIGFCNEVKVLQSQTVKHFDEAGNEIFREVIEQSPVKGALNVKKVYPDGKEKIISKAYIKDGMEIVEKNLEALDGTKTLYRFESGNGKNTMNYTIVSKDGKTLLNQTSTYETISENHYKTSKNGIYYDIKIEDNNFIVTNENTNQTITLNIGELTEGTEKNIISLLKQFSGDELSKISETGLKNIKFKTYNIEAHFSPKEKQIVFGEGSEDFGTILHEFGHAKDKFLYPEEISSNPELLKIYNLEREAFRNNFSESQLEHISYFTSDHHYTGSIFKAGNPLIEGVAETNTLLNTHPHNDIQSLRAHYWQQYFPNTISFIAHLI